MHGTDEALDAATVDDLGELYNVELRSIADRLAPERSVTIRRRASDPWFDDECRTRSVLCVPLNVLPVVLSHSPADIAQWSTLSLSVTDPSGSVFGTIIFL